jgi:hypothetical protein
MRTACILVMTFIFAGCDSSTDPGEDDVQWSTTLLAEADFPGVTGTGTAATVDGASTASVSIAGATAAAVHPWHVHAGTCADGGPIVGEATAYPPLQIGEDGANTQNATITTTLVPNSSYFINVHLSPEDLATIVACGDLVLQ